MSLEQAYALQGQRTSDDPVQRGLSAGQAAYKNASNRGGVDLSALRDAAARNSGLAEAQRQILANNAAKQASGLYGNTGTSASVYDYLQGKGDYPVNPASSPTRPIQQPYEQATNVGSPTQSSLAKDAQTSPTQMGARPTPPLVAKPSAVNQLLGTLGPMYLGYPLSKRPPSE